MNPERWERIRHVYHSAREVQPERREAFLRELCGGDESLFQEVTSLLAQEGKSEGLFESPALEVIARKLAVDEAQKPQENLIGRTLSHYRIEKKIGEGGMGEVFLAHDTSLNRKVALKFLPAGMQQDPSALKRFRREARSAAALNNPYICSIHEVGEFEGKEYIVMEYVDGQTLMDKLRRGPLPLNQALQIATEVAEALHVAHGKGIVHRDLKPANIMLTKTGHAKVMDFGLAKQASPPGDEETHEESVSAVTRSGVTLGTLSYMSPEQVRGQLVDARSDIFSFGLVLYEMLTGTHPFSKETPMETASAILHEEARPASAIARETPSDLEKLISRCLRKDVERRFQHIGDVKIALLELKENLDAGGRQTGPAVTTLARPGWTVALVVTGLVLVAAGLYWVSRQWTPLPEPLVPKPLTTYPGYENIPSFSPDGNFVAFEWCGEAPGANCDIYIKQIGVEPPSQLTGDPAVDFSPSWSPDGLFIAFLRQISPTKSAIIAIPRTGGRERVLGESNVLPINRIWASLPFLTWTRDSKWLVVPSLESGQTMSLSLLSLETLEKKRLTKPPAGSEDLTPAFSPDGETLAFTRWRGDKSDLIMMNFGADYRPKLEQQISTGTGEPFVWAADWAPNGGDIVFSCGFYGTGSLWRMTASSSAKPQRLAIASEDVRVFALSPAGNRLAYTVPNLRFGIWRFDVSAPSQTPTAAFQLMRSTRSHMHPTYSPDGRRIAYSSAITGQAEIWVSNADGSDAVPLTSFRKGEFFAPKWSPDGQNIAFVANVGGHDDIYVMRANQQGSPRRLGIDPAGSVPWPCWSGDSQSIYFRSHRSGESEIWKMPATGGDAIQITANGGDLPQEHGKFLYYLNGDRYPAQCSIWRRPTGGGETKVVDSTACVDFEVGEQGIYFFTPHDRHGRTDINLYEFATGRTRKILTIEQSPLSIAVSPNGRTILFTQADRVGSDLMLVENFR